VPDMCGVVHYVTLKDGTVLKLEGPVWDSMSEETAKRMLALLQELEPPSPEVIDAD